MEELENIVDSEESRRSFMKKGAVASGTVALGVAGTGTVTAVVQQENHPNQALMFAYDYHPNLSFGVVDRLQQQTVDDILGRTTGENGDQIVSDPTEYNGYVIQYQPDDGMGEYTFVFVRDETLSTETTYQFTPGDVTYFNTDVNLLQVGLGNGGDGTGDGGDGNGGGSDGNGGGSDGNGGGTDNGTGDTAGGNGGGTDANGNNSTAGGNGGDGSGG